MTRISLVSHKIVFNISVFSISVFVLLTLLFQLWQRYLSFTCYLSVQLHRVVSVKNVYLQEVCLWHSFIISFEPSDFGFELLILCDFSWLPDWFRASLYGNSKSHVLSGLCQRNLTFMLQPLWFVHAPSDSTVQSVILALLLPRVTNK